MTNPFQRGSARFFPVNLKCTRSSRWDGLAAATAICLRLASAHGFDALVTVDRGIEYQQNQAYLTIPVIIMVAHQNRLPELRPLVPKVITVVSGNLQKRIYLVSG